MRCVGQLLELGQLQMRSPRLLGARGKGFAILFIEEYQSGFMVGLGGFSPTLGLVYIRI